MKKSIYTVTVKVMSRRSDHRIKYKTIKIKISIKEEINNIIKVYIQTQKLETHMESTNKQESIALLSHNPKTKIHKMIY